MTSRRKPAEQARRRPGYGFVLPQIVLMATFVFWPVVMLIYYSTTKYDGISEPQPVGLDNYRFLFSWNDFHQILINNAVLIAGVFIWVAVPFVLAIAIFPMRNSGLIRAILYVPAMLPPIIVGGIFRIVLANDGPINSGLKSVGMGFLAPEWFTDPNFVLVTIILVITWATAGSGILFYSSGLAAISPSYIEAAQLDGVNKWQMIWYIYRPALRPITRFWILLLTVTTVTGFFPWIYGLTQGGPGVSSTTLDYAIYVSLNRGGELGRGAAIAVIAMVFVGVIVLIQAGMRKIRAASEWS